MAGGEGWLSVGAYLPVCAEYVAVAAEYLFFCGVPYDELLVGGVAGVEFVKVEALAGASA